MTTTDTDRVPVWVHMAEVPPPTDEEPWVPLADDNHVTPVGCWLLASFGLLALLVLIAWRITRA